MTVRLLASTKFLKQRPDLVKTWLGVQVELTQWINAHKDAAKRTLNAEIERLVGKGLRADVLDDAFSRMDLTDDPIKSSLTTSAQSAYELAFLGKQRPNLAGIYDLAHLNEVLKQRGRKGIE